MYARRRQGTRATQLPIIHAKSVNVLMNFLRQNFKGKNLAKFDDKNSVWIITIPTVFSFIKNPQETLDTIFSLVEISKHQKISREFSIFFDHSYLKEMDMGASIAFDIVAMNLRKELSMNGINSRFSGRFPESEMLCQILKSMGITKHLNIRGAEPSDIAEQLFVRFPLHIGYGQIGSEFGGQQHREKAATHLVTYLNECLEKASNFSFTDEGQRQILKWAGEIITNAEEHSGHRQWYAIGCMTPHISKEQDAQDGRVIGECQLTIFGFGRSIYESLSSQETSQEMKKAIASLASKHTRFFNSFEKYSDKDLWTLYALQDGISRFSLEPGKSTRGKGTVEMIEAFENLGSSVDLRCVPEMSLISGSTRIYFNNKYHLREQDVRDGKRKIIAFNENNSLDEKPDSEHVNSLAGHFPGTLLTFSTQSDT